MNNNNKVENPNAFPGDFFDDKKGERVEFGGMTLRDYFAAKAMQSMAIDLEYTTDEIASLSYGFADAMLLERSKKDE